MIATGEAVMKVNEIFVSVDGEVNCLGQGHPSTFIRLQGCNLRCKYCDTLYAQSEEGADEMGIPEILERMNEIACPKITITGGEPLVQAETHALVDVLIEEGFVVSMETNGSLPLTGLNPVLDVVMDWKLQSSGAQDNMLTSNLALLKPTDWLKFVIADIDDYAEAMSVYGQAGCRVAFSPCHPVLKPAVLFRWMKEDGLFDVWLNVQLHKYMGLR